MVEIHFGFIARDARRAAYKNEFSEKGPLFWHSSTWDLYILYIYNNGFIYIDLN